MVRRLSGKDLIFSDFTAIGGLHPFPGEMRCRRHILLS
jgi:hypothetical protein